MNNCKSILQILLVEPKLFKKDLKAKKYLFNVHKIVYVTGKISKVMNSFVTIVQQMFGKVNVLIVKLEFNVIIKIKTKWKNAETHK